MNTTDISIEDLWPGEIVLDRKKFDEKLGILESGEALPPIIVINIEGKNIVRDGNTRIRAFIEFTEKHKKAIKKISSEFVTPGANMTEEIRRNYLKLAIHYGKGIKAFKKLPITNSTAEYDAEQYRVQQLLDKMKV